VTKKLTQTILYLFTREIENIMAKMPNHMIQWRGRDQREGNETYFTRD